ncbi:MAG: hypothetical protein HY647_04500 [Acidobacteria bacterium]|nr:hypothetical protein [Acidobacteriota bacterium]
MAFIQVPPEPPKGFYSPRHVELVKKLTEKTRAKKIPWKSSSTGFSAVVSGKLEINFVRSSGLFSLLESLQWSVFTIRDKAGNEILQVDNTKSRPFTSPGAPTEVLRSAISELYAAIESSLVEEVDKAIEVIDGI